MFLGTWNYPEQYTKNIVGALQIFVEWINVLLSKDKLDLNGQLG